MKLNLEVIRFNTEDVITTSGAATPSTPSWGSASVVNSGNLFVALTSEVVEAGNSDARWVSENWVLAYEDPTYGLDYGDNTDAPQSLPGKYAWYDNGAWYSEGLTWQQTADKYGLTTDPTGWRTSN